MAAIDIEPTGLDLRAAHIVTAALWRIDPTNRLDLFGSQLGNIPVAAFRDRERVRKDGRRPRAEHDRSE
ncbi:hypothetical protein ACFXKD_12155 [Nocardiopsis aegyptia]|uniref:hypothetical protein n=1 Tax=Nocardiopsis aegyptia TaxID=220378 RepID=UPI0036733326